LGLLSGCFWDKEDSDSSKDNNPPIENKAVLESIYLSDLEGKEIESDIAYVGEKYLHSKIIVNAKYSDNKVKNVTSSAVFSTVDTSSKKTVECKVTYLEKETTYSVNVLENTIRFLKLDISKIARLYQLNDVFDRSNLKVQANYVSGSSKTITDYDCVIRNPHGKIHSEEEAFTEPGTYTVHITYGNVSNKFEIGVYNPFSFGQNRLSADTYAEALTIPTNGKLSLSNGESIYQSAGVNLTVGQNGSVLETKNSKGEVINKEFGENSYHSLFRTDANEGLSLQLDFPTEIMMIADGTSGIGIQFVNEAQEDLYPISNSENGMRLYYISLPVGKYKLVSSFDTIELYDFYFHNDSTPITEQQFDHIELDTTQGVKLNFNANDVFEFTGLKVYGINQLGQRQLLSSNEYRVELETPFNETGSYKVKVTYIGLVSCSNKNADYSVSYTAASQIPPLDIEVTPNNYTKITASLSKTEFYLENYDISSLKVFAVLEDNSKEELSLDDCTLRLLYQNQECDGFTEFGEYILEITYQGTKNISNPTTSLKLKNISPIITITFGESGIGSSATETYEIDLRQPFNYEDYIKEYDGYTFGGFSSDFKDLTYRHDGHIFKRYYEQNSSEQFTIVYLGPNYERTGYIEYVNPGDAIPLPDIADGSLESYFRDYNFEGWNLGVEEVATSHMYVLPICSIK
ncbi:MAG: hypothetical protein K2H02_01260, partial [Anaeroplasmataceae bacterium]|nr:hypothetical protein [Anaeroplasmataceae bacterium]